MRHHDSYRKLGRTSAHRRSLFRSLSTSLVMHEQCETTVEKAKDLRVLFEKLVTEAKSGTLQSRRIVAAYLMTPEAVAKLMSDVAPRFKNRAGGYTRILRTRERHGDSASMAIISLVSSAEEAAPAKKKSAKKASKKKADAPAEAEKATA